MADGIVLTGPTATGKTELAIAVAKQLRGEIVSLDSRQVYRGMDIGTAKPDRSQLAEVPHLGIDILAPSERYSAGSFARDARRWIAEIRRRSHLPILAGGTGFFLRALTHPMFVEPALDSARREQLKQYLEGFTGKELLNWLAVLDDVTAQRLARGGGRQRVARAIEVALLTGRPLSAWHQEQQPGDPLDFVTFVLELPRAELYARIDRRVDRMVEAGLAEEVKALLAAGYDERAPALNATGYIELIPYVRGEASLDSAVEAIKRATRRYARRQHTWFRHQLPPGAIALDATKSVAVLTEQVVSTWKSTIST